ncbi:AsnC family protein [compost metagenome]
MIFVYRYDRMRGEEVLNALRSIPEIVQCEVMSGEFDLMLRVDAATPERVHLVWKEISAMPGVSNTVTSFVLSSVI